MGAESGKRQMAAEASERFSSGGESVALERAARAAGFELSRFRDEVREYCRTSIPASIRDKAHRLKYFSKEDRVLWQRALHKQGWFCAHWPAEHGGQSWGPIQRFVLIEELERAGTPWLAHFGVSFMGPVLCEFGTQAQRDQHLPGIRQSDVWWCQGFSEPGAGSDLASLRMQAVREGDHYRVNGQKTWTTMAQWADWIFCLVRTGQTERAQQGISFLLIDLKSPGVTVRPIETFDGVHHVNEVFLDNVEVPAENLVGKEGQGWDIAKFIVSRERVLVAEVGKARHLLDQLWSLMDTSDALCALAARRRVVDLEVAYDTLRATAYAAVIDAEQGRENPLDASVLKIRGSELQQKIGEALLDTLSESGLAFQAEALHGAPKVNLESEPRLAGFIHEQLHGRAASIYGGSNEIQRGILAKTLLRG